MALVLSRKDGQSVYVDGCAKITVYSSTKVRVMIEAPETTHIRRGELPERNEGNGRSTLQQ